MNQENSFLTFLRWVNHVTASFLLLFLLFGLVIGLALTGDDDEEPMLVSDNATVVIDPSGVLVERPQSPDPLDFLELEEGSNTLNDLLYVVEQATEDDQVQALLLRLEELVGLNESNITVLGDALNEFKATGKKIIAYGYGYSQSQYLLASYADEILLHPMGEMLLTGFSVNRSYFFEALESLGIKMHLFRVGSYKSAAEPFIQNHMSDEDRASKQDIIETFWNAYQDRLIANRSNLTAGQLSTLIETPDELLKNADGNLAQMAMDVGLVDGIMDTAELSIYIKDLTGSEDDNEMNYHDYLASKQGNKDYESFSDDGYLGDNQIGLIVAEGPVVSQRANRDNAVIAADSITELIREAREDFQIKALVIRMNTPGGSAFASEVIRRELELTRQAGKPVVVSMGSVAASGGYWIASAANQIWALPTTLTGSIGVFALIPTFKGTAQKLGIATDGVNIGALSGITLTRELPAAFSRVVQLGVDNTYDRFIRLVAAGRGLSTERVRELAEGRVWTGEKALRNGLVDKSGGLQEALDSAAELAGIDDWKLRRLYQKGSWKERLLEKLSIRMVGVELAYLNTLMQPLKDMQQIGLLDGSGRPYALCVWCQPGE